MKVKNSVGIYMRLLGQFQTFYSFYEKTSHTPKAQKALKALKAQKVLKGTKTLGQKHKTQISEQVTIFPLDVFQEHFLFLFTRKRFVLFCACKIFS